MLNPIMVMSKAVAPVAVSLTRTTLGRLYAGGATPIANVRPAFNAGDWVAQAGSVFLSTNNLVISITPFGATGYAYCAPIAARSDVYMQANWIAKTRTGDAPGLVARYQNVAGGDLVTYARSFNSEATIYERTGGVVVRERRVPPSFDRPSRIHMRLNGTNMAGKAFAQPFQIQLGSIGGSAGSVGLLIGNFNGIQNGASATFDELYATRSHLLTVTSSLTSGWYVVLADASNAVLATSDNAIGGTATIDMYQLQVTLPLAVKIEIREYDTGNLLISETPIETVWPGDEWTFTPASGYTPPVIVSRLTKSTTGKIFALANIANGIWNVTDGFVIGDWTGFSGTGTSTPSVGVTTQTLTISLNSGSGSRGARFNLLTIPQNHFLIAGRSSQTTGGFPGVASRMKAATPTLDSVFCGIPIGYSGTYGLIESVGGVTVQQAVSGTAARTVGATSVHSQWVRGLLATSRQTSAAGTGVADSTLNLPNNLAAGTNGDFAAVYTGSGSANAFNFQSFAVTSTPIISVNGPNTGTWQVRLRNAAGTLIYTSPSHTSGVVNINTQTEMTVLYGLNGISLMAQIEIYDPAGATVLRGPETPVGYLWGGDIWSWN